MYSHVDLEPASSGVSLVAPRSIANEGFFTSVGQLVGLKMAFGDELLKALKALKRSLSCVRSHMRLKVTCLREFFQTRFERAKQDLLLVLGSFNLFKLA